MSGIQPTGIMHLGNYLGAVQNWIKMQEIPDCKRFYCIVDYHSITTTYVSKEQMSKEDPEPQELSLKTAATLLACGVDIKKSNLFIQSHVPAHTELAWILMCFTPMSWLNKMIQYKEKKNDKDNTSIALFNYPWLMAADILLYQATKVPVGEDQTQHLELAHDLIERINNYAGLELPLPENIKSAHQRVMSLVNADNKMSKSDPAFRSRINLIDDAEMIREKVKKAKSDSFGAITYDPKNKNYLSIIK